MALNENEIKDALWERQMADKALDRFGALRTFYESDFQQELRDVYKVYRGDWYMEWPDGKVEMVDPNVPNMVRIASEDRARGVSATPPQFICHPEGPGDDARAKADKLERIVGSWAHMNRIQGHTTQSWAYDAMAGGLTVCKVMPDFKAIKEGRSKEAFPVFTRLDPLLSYPSPVFTPGPFVDDFIYAYEEKVRTIENRYNVKFDWAKNKASAPDTCRVIEYLDDTYFYVVAEEIANSQTNRKTRRELLVAEKHRMSCCPVVIGARATMVGPYSGEFGSGLGVLQYWNRLMGMVMDDAIRKVYPERITLDVINAHDYGPDAEIQLENPNSRYEYVAQPNQPFSNLQILRDVGGSVRTSFNYSPARSGDPNESIISAAGVGAVDSSRVEDVRSITRDIIAPMLEAANHVALECEEKWTPNVSKTVYGGTGSQRYKETYKPSEDINGYRKVEVRYGPMSGLDEINQAVLTQQFHGNGGMSTRRMMELNPMIEDPQREEKRILLEQLQSATVAGLVMQAQQGQIDSFTLATIQQAVESDEVTLAEAVAALVPQAPLAQPTGQAPSAEIGASGIPGAAEGQAAQPLPGPAELGIPA